MHEELIKRVDEIEAFLNGSGQLDGLSFGDNIMGQLPKYWWRASVRELFELVRTALTAPQAETCEHVWQEGHQGVGCNKCGAWRFSMPKELPPQQPEHVQELRKLQQELTASAYSTREQANKASKYVVALEVLLKAAPAPELDRRSAMK